MPTDSEILAKWSDSAPFWEKHSELIRGLFAPVAAALIESAAVTPGQSVLDVATGPGDPAVTLAAAVGPEGQVTGVDPIPEMIAAARRIAAEKFLPNVRFEVALAGSLPFADASFDAVVSRFGIMFFPSPLDGLREILRVLRPGRRLALAVWHLPKTNPFFHALTQVVERFIEIPHPDHDAPDAFRFAAPGKLLALFNEAGIAEPTEHLLRFPISAPLSPEEFYTLRVEMSDSLRDRIAQLPADRLARLRLEAIESLRTYATPAGISFPAEVFIVSGVKRA